MNQIATNVLKSVDCERKCILVVEDRKPLRELFAHFLKLRGYKTQTAASLEEAEAQLLNCRFDAVLLDVLLPDGCGISFIPRLRSLQSNLRVIVLTGLGYDEAVIAEALSHGANSYVSKMLPFDQVLLEIQRLLKAIPLTTTDAVGS